jgi:hypothetical protein
MSEHTVNPTPWTAPLPNAARQSGKKAWHKPTATILHVDATKSGFSGGIEELSTNKPGS